ncbi:hypothetical protein [Burkholderia territorii]|uniref:hypothetical protein n=1 Tax=Burkholderia territorii TaxID=1503055 RepID=UPI000A761BE6|nr:hypothetical protein [Burkholderia territorii]
MKKMKAYGVIALTVVLAACGKQPGDEYVGTWKRVSGPDSDFVIEKKGNAFIVSYKEPDGNSTYGKPLPDVVVHESADLEGDQLVVSGGRRIRLKFNESSGHLIFDQILGREELEKVK